MIVGVVGISGSGKTTVAKLIEARGFHRISLDDLAKEITPQLLPEIAKKLGSGYIVDGQLDRKALGARVFGDPDSLRLLNSVYAEPLWDALEDQIKFYPDTVVDGFDLPTDLHPDILFYVHAPEAVLLARLLAREPWSPLSVLRDRVKSQRGMVVPPAALRVDIDTTRLQGEELETFLANVFRLHEVAHRA